MCRDSLGDSGDFERPPLPRYQTPGDVAKRQEWKRRWGPETGQVYRSKKAVGTGRRGPDTETSDFLPR